MTVPVTVSEQQSSVSHSDSDSVIYSHSRLAVLLPLRRTAALPLKAAKENVLIDNLRLDTNRYTWIICM